MSTVYNEHSPFYYQVNFCKHFKRGRNSVEDDPVSGQSSNVMFYHGWKDKMLPGWNIITPITVKQVHRTQRRLY